MSAVRFSNRGAFTEELRSAALAHLSAERRRSARLLLIAKIPIAWGLLFGSWATLLLLRPGGVLLAGLILTLMAGATLTAFSVQHDANHGATLGTRRWNHLIAWMGSDLALGFSSYVWRVKHNVAHHTYPNVSGYDDDIEQTPFLKLTPEQEPRWWYRYQHLYVWALYALMGIRWQAGGDYLALRKELIGKSPLRPPQGWDRAGIILGKLLFAGWALVAPLTAYPWWGVLGCYLLIVSVLGVVMATTFQLAHCVDEVEFPRLSDLAGQKMEWSIHQLGTTADFCPRNRLLTWWLGGLNFQVVHHLFPREPHTLYPDLSGVVKRLALKHGLRYTVHPSLASAVRSHVRHLREMGRLGQKVDLEMG